MTKKLHPADAADRALIAEATGFNAHLRISPTKKINHPAASLADAVQAADAIRAENPGRNVLVYAILATGASIPVPKDMQAAAREQAAEAASRAAAPAAGPAKVQPRAIGKKAANAEAALRGELPAPPNFSAATHARFRKKLGELVALAEAGDVAGLRGVAINPVSSSPKAMARYRDLAVTAIEARLRTAA